MFIISRPLWVNGVEKVGFLSAIKFELIFRAQSAQIIGDVAVSEALLGGFSYDYYYPLI